MLKVLNIIFWTLVASAMLVSVGFVEIEQSKLPCTGIQINISNDGETFFVEENDIVEMLLSRGENIIGQPVSEIGITEIEYLIQSNPSVKNAEVYTTVSGELVIDVEQRKPIARVINMNGESYYIDEDAKLMPLSEKYTAHVMIITGNILDNYAANYETILSEKSKTNIEDTSTHSNLAACYKMAQFISADKLWKAQVEQIHFDSENEMIIVPRVGNHKIIFGDTTDMAEKFEKLKMFYLRGLNNTGWNHYSYINLKFKNQVVCKRKSKILIPKSQILNPKSQILNPDSLILNPDSLILNPKS